MIQVTSRRTPSPLTAEAVAQPRSLYPCVRPSSLLKRRAAAAGVEAPVLVSGMPHSQPEHPSSTIQPQPKQIRAAG
jgi:hypothetical protein